MIEDAVTVAFDVSVRDLTHRDLPWCSWSGSALHLRYVAAALDRVPGGGVDYLAACPPSNLPVGIGGVDYDIEPACGTLWQFAVHPALQSCGIGSALVRAAERRIGARGLSRAELAVADDNPRARALYDRLGYVAHGRSTAAWDVMGADGAPTRYETPCTLMGKNLT